MALATTCVALSCANLTQEETFSTGSLEQAVVSGYTAENSHSVVYLPGCTGILIAPNLVLTALHCVAPITGDNDFTCTAEGDLENPPNGQLGAHVDPSEIIISLGAAFSRKQDAIGVQILSTQSTQICQNDLAFVLLDRNLDEPISPVRLDEPVQVGELLSVVGYGLTANPEDLPPGEMVARRRRDDIPVVAVGSTLDQPEGGEALPRTFALGESVCKGDSGGPAMSSEGAVVGVYSTFIGGCTGEGSRNFYTMLSEFKPLVLQAYALADAVPWLEGEVSPGVASSDPETPDAGDGETPPPTPTQSSQALVSGGFCSVPPRGPLPQNTDRSTGWGWLACAAFALTRRRFSKMPRAT